MSCSDEIIYSWQELRYCPLFYTASNENQGGARSWKKGIEYNYRYISDMKGRFYQSVLYYSNMNNKDSTRPAVRV